VPSGATIVLLAIGIFIVLAALATPLARKRAKAAAVAEEGCTLEVPPARATADDVRV
jgi:zinc transport system permease protein